MEESSGALVGAITNDRPAEIDLSTPPKERDFERESG